MATKKVFTDESLATLVDETKSYVDSAVSTKANSSHNHSASNITSGTLSSDRLPTVPIAKGGTGATTAAAALTNLGITATASELNKLDGVTATTAELNYVDGVTSNIQTQLDGKAANSNFVKSGSGAKAGLVPAPSTTAGTTKYLREDGTWAVPPDNNTVYTHPTTSGNKHIPSGGSSGQILRWSADGTAAWGADNNTTYSQATSSALGLVKIGYTESGQNYPVELNSSGQMYVNVPWTDNNTVYTHPSYTARTGVPTANATPAFGGAFTVSQPVSDSTGHITAINSRTITIPNAVASTSANGLMSSTDKSKLDSMQIATISELETYLGI